MLIKLYIATAVIILGMFVRPMLAQLTDIRQTPNSENAGIQKSLDAQIGAGQGDMMPPDTSHFLIMRDPFRSIVRGRQLFQRKFTRREGLGPRTDDGIGDIESNAALGAGLADSCAACHGRPRGAAGFGGAVFTRPDSRDAPHLFGLGLQEMLADEITQKLRSLRAEAIVQAQQRDTPVRLELVAKTIHYGSITAFPDGTVDTSEVEGVDPDLRVWPFFAQGATLSIREFIVGAFKAEMGLEAFDPAVLGAAADGQRVVTPAGMVLDGAVDAIEAPPVRHATEDADGDGVSHEIDPALIDHLEFYLLNYFKPGSYESTARTRRGRQRMQDFGCTTCHIPTLHLAHDRRVADVDTAFHADHSVFNRLFATAVPLSVETDDGSGLPTLKEPAGAAFEVRDIFTDFKRHDLGPAFWERNFDGTLTRAFMTEALWGVGSTPPYGHDGCSINLREVILRHGGEAQAARDAFAAETRSQQDDLIAFLQTLVLFSPSDTAATLDPGDASHRDYPQRGHGSIDLSVLFNDPTDAE